MAADDKHGASHPQYLHAASLGPSQTAWLEEVLGEKPLEWVKEQNKVQNPELLEMCSDALESMRFASTQWANQRRARPTRKSSPSSTPRRARECENDPNATVLGFLLWLPGVQVCWDPTEPQDTGNMPMAEDDYQDGPG